jgi:hypothetical protein
MQSSYRAIAEWLRAQADRGHLREHDSEAAAAVIHGGLVMFKVIEAVWREKTLPVDDERFKQAWCDLVGRGLGLDQGDISEPSAPRKPRERQEPTRDQVRARDCWWQTRARHNQATTRSAILI